MAFDWYWAIDFMEYMQLPCQILIGRLDSCVVSAPILFSCTNVNKRHIQCWFTRAGGKRSMRIMKCQDLPLSPTVVGTQRCLLRDQQARPELKWSLVIFNVCIMSTLFHTRLKISFKLQIITHFCSTKTIKCIWLKLISSVVFYEPEKWA